MLKLAEGVSIYVASQSVDCRKPLPKSLPYIEKIHDLSDDKSNALVVVL